MGLNSSHFGLSPCFGLQFAMGFNHSRVGPQIVMSSKSHQLCTCPWSSTCSLDSSSLCLLSLFWLFHCHSLQPLFWAPILQWPSQGQPPTSWFPLCIQPLPHGLWPLLCCLGLTSFSPGFSPSPVVLAHSSGSCFMVLLLCLASAPGGLLSVCPWGSFSGREGCCAVSVCLSCRAGCSGAGGAVLCWQCPGPREQSEQEPGMGRGAQQLQGGGCCRSCCAKSKSTCTGHGSGTAQGCSFLHRLK